MLRFGKITEIDVSKCYARVKFLDDGIVSAPLQIVVMGALTTKFFHIFDINEQVACLMDENSEEGVILGALFSDDINPIGGNKDVVKVVFLDDSTIEYNRNSHEYNIDIKGKINITAETEINIEAPTVNINTETANVTATEVNIDAVTNITGAVEITGNVNVTGTLTTSEVITAPSISANTISGDTFTMDGSGLNVDGPIEGTSVKAGTIDLESHKHGGVQTGVNQTTVAIP